MNGVSLADALQIGPDIWIDAGMSFRNRREHPAVVVAVQVGLSLTYLHSPAACCPTIVVYLDHVTGVSETN